MGNIPIFNKLRKMASGSWPAIPYRGGLGRYGTPAFLLHASMPWKCPGWDRAAHFSQILKKDASACSMRRCDFSTCNPHKSA
jgi:hypothetical protein